MISKRTNERGETRGSHLQILILSFGDATPYASSSQLLVAVLSYSLFVMQVVTVLLGKPKDL